MNVADLLASPGPYAGIGSRETPAMDKHFHSTDVLLLMERIASTLAKAGHTLRSGCAPGADQAFERGALAVGGRTELYLPWSWFEGRSPDLVHLSRPTPRAYEIAAQHHPNWRKLRQHARALHARNVHQILGVDCTTPARFVVCWTPGAAEVGGTGQALRIAAACGVPVWNLQRADHRAEWEALV